MSLFNGHYDNWCYLPMLGFLQFDDEPDQYLFAHMLRDGRAHASLGAIPLLRRAIRCLRKAFPKACIRVRLDGGFATPEIFTFLDQADVEYVVAMARNSVLEREAESCMERVRKQAAATGESAREFGETNNYKAGRWEHKRRVVFKAEVTCHPGRAPKNNPRFVVTNLQARPEQVYEGVYCQRAVAELRIKELLHGMNIDRMSCTRFLANQFRGLLTAAAYVLIQELRLKAKRTGLAHAQVHTLRERLLKLAVWVQSSTRRIVLHLPKSAPWRSDWCRIARAMRAAPT